MVVVFVVVGDLNALTSYQNDLYVLLLLLVVLVT